MKKLLLSSAILALTAGAALAADLPSRKAEPAYVPPPPPPMWTGFYAGMNAGYGFGTSNSVVSTGIPLFDDFATSGYGTWGETAFVNAGRANVNQNGFIGGGQVGYNYQWGPNFVIGLEADIQGTGIQGSGGSVGIVQSTVAGSGYNVDRFHGGSTNVNAGLYYMGTVAGRLGYLVTPTLLTYARGGLAYGGAHARVSGGASGVVWDDIDYYNNQSFSNGASNTLVGWHVGGGLEWMFMPNWSLKAEAFYYDLGTLTVNNAVVGTPGFYSLDEGYGWANAITTRVGYQGVVARAGINYHFNWGSAAPIVAKY